MIDHSQTNGGGQTKGEKPGENGATDSFTIIYDDLREIAHRMLRKWVGGGTLQTTALVHEAYVRMTGRSGNAYHDRTHFLAMAARAMRSVLIDDIRHRCAAKRDSDHEDIDLSRISMTVDGFDVELLALDEALRKLASFDPRKAQMVELRFFAGCSISDAAEVLSVSTATIKRDWNIAKAWLYREIQRGDHPLPAKE